MWSWRVRRVRSLVYAASTTSGAFVRRGCPPEAWVPPFGMCAFPWRECHDGRSAGARACTKFFKSTAYFMLSVSRRCVGVCFRTVTCPDGESFHSCFHTRGDWCYRGFQSWESSRHHLGNGFPQRARQRLPRTRPSLRFFCFGCERYYHCFRLCRSSHHLRDGTATTKSSELVSFWFHGRCTCRRVSGIMEYRW